MNSSIKGITCWLLDLIWIHFKAQVGAHNTIEREGGLTDCLKVWSLSGPVNEEISRTFLSDTRASEISRQFLKAVVDRQCCFY